MAQKTEKKNPLLDLMALIERGTMEKTVKVVGKEFCFRSLFDEDYNWRDQFINMESPAAMITSARTPTLAIATVSIDGVLVSELEGMDSSDGEFTKFANARKLYTTVYSKLPRKVIEKLHQFFVEEIELPSRKIDEEELGNS